VYSQKSPTYREVQLKSKREQSKNKLAFPLCWCALFLLENTYLQYDSPLGFDTHTPLFLHGDGEQLINAEN
jgi:hypothetical protein